MKQIIFLFWSLILVSCSSKSITAQDDFIFIDGGSFVLGPRIEEVDATKDIPFLYSETRQSYLTRYKVTVSSFFIKKNIVSNSEWNKFAKKEGRLISKENGNLPYASATFRDTLEYCNWLSSTKGYEPVYIIKKDNATWDRSKNGYRLLTEAEWEFAAMGGNYSKGFRYPGSNDISEISNGITKKMYPIGSKKPNELGIYDLCGNAGEVVWDFYSPTFSNPKMKDPIGPEQAMYLSPSEIDRGSQPGDFKYHVQKGGQYRLDPTYFFMTKARGVIEENQPYSGIRIGRSNQ